MKRHVALLFTILTYSLASYEQNLSIEKRADLAILLVQGYPARQPAYREMVSSRTKELRLKLEVPDFFFKDHKLRLRTLNNAETLLDHILPADSMVDCAVEIELISQSDFTNRATFEVGIAFQRKVDSARLSLTEFTECLPFYCDFCYSATPSIDSYERQLTLKEVEYSPDNVSPTYFTAINDYMNLACENQRPPAAESCLSLRIFYEGKHSEKEYYFDSFNCSKEPAKLP